MRGQGDRARNATRSPLVSVVIPVHNGGELLQRAIDSVLAQTEPDLELIVVDDGSRDNTWETIAAAAAADPRVRGLRNDASLRAPATSNRGIEAAQGRWIAILDHDDWYHPRRLEAFLRAGERANADLVADNQSFFDAQAGKVFRTAFRAGEGARAFTLRTLLKNARTGVPVFDYGMLKPMIRADFLHRSGVRYRTGYHEGYDFHFLLDAFARGCSALLLGRPYYFYTVPFGPLSRQPAYANKKLYDYGRMRAFTEEAIEEHRALLSPRELRLLARRARSIGAYSRYLAFRGDLRGRRLREILAGLSDPRVYPFLGRAAARRVLRTLSGAGDLRRAAAESSADE